MQINLSSNVREVISDVDLMFSDQVPFAIAKAMTDTARKVAAAMPAQLEQSFDRPTDFTRKGFYSQGARKDNLEAVVGVKDKQQEYLGFGIVGGERRPKNKALRLPSKTELDAYGNLPKGLIKTLVAAAKSGKKISGKASKKFNIAQESRFFYGKPRGGDLPVGLYSRRNAQGHRSLVPLVVFPQQSARYESRFDFTGAAVKVVEDEFEAALESAWHLAQSTAK